NKGEPLSNQIEEKSDERRERKNSPPNWVPMKQLACQTARWRDDRYILGIQMVTPTPPEEACLEKRIVLNSIEFPH
ncbi:MAG: hypothetical protein WB608_07600, partial [Terracidiphilus sp.]